MLHFARKKLYVIAVYFAFLDSIFLYTIKNVHSSGINNNVASVLFLNSNAVSQGSFLSNSSNHSKCTHKHKKPLSVFDSVHTVESFTDLPKKCFVGIEAHVQLAAPTKMFCSCNSTSTAIVSSNDDCKSIEDILCMKKRSSLFNNLSDIINTIAVDTKNYERGNDIYFKDEPMKFNDYVKKYTKNIEKLEAVTEEYSDEMYLQENKFKCPVCTGEAGSLPFISPLCILYGIAASKVFGCKINNRLSFVRKCYDYFDLPKCYQITQSKNPLGRNGYVILDNDRRITIKQIHLEEDTAKRVSTPTDTLHTDKSDIELDYNRSGIGLIEIVTTTELLTIDEVIDTCKKIASKLTENGITNGIMHKGNIRFDINLSLPSSSDKRIEIKNLNSFKRIKRAISQYYNLDDVYTAGTMLWDERDKKVVLARSKEDQASYLNTPELNIPEMLVDEDVIERVSTALQH